MSNVRACFYVLLQENHYVDVELASDLDQTNAVNVLQKCKIAVKMFQNAR